MLDRYFITPRPQHVSVHHTEKRAPTDESVRLLREMEDKARGQVVEAVRLTSASVEAVVHRYDDQMSLKTHFAIHYKLNGLKREVRLSVDDYKSDIHARVDEVWKAVANDIAAVLVSSVAKQVVGR